MDVKPTRCVVTRLGLVAFGLVLANFLYVVLHQRIATGQFIASREPFVQWVSPRWTRNVVLYGTPTTLLMLLVGAIVDTARDARWKRHAKKS